jgi:hypothetical protein
MRNIFPRLLQNRNVLEAFCFFSLGYSTRINQDFTSLLNYVVIQPQTTHACENLMFALVYRFNKLVLRHGTENWVFLLS